MRIVVSLQPLFITIKVNRRTQNMIRKLRQRHRRIAIALGALLPLAFAVGMAARKDVPHMRLLPKDFIEPSSAFAVPEWDRADLFAKTPIRVELLRQSAGVGNFAVRFSGAPDMVKPDLIVYWVLGNLRLTNSVPDNACLLGAFNLFVALPLPTNAVSDGGVLAIYSLAAQEIVEVSKPFTLPKP